MELSSLRLPSYAKYLTFTLCMVVFEPKSIRQLKDVFPIESADTFKYTKKFDVILSSTKPKLIHDSTQH